MENTFAERLAQIALEKGWIYIDDKGRTITRLKPQQTVEQYRAHSGGLWGSDTITEITETTGANDNET
tara:strand:+ start:275 stop:478 length:204 start_codon:yes stop_codon:yes gene_type:complete